MLCNQQRYQRERERERHFLFKKGQENCGETKNLSQDNKRHSFNIDTFIKDEDNITKS